MMQAVAFIPAEFAQRLIRRGVMYWLLMRIALLLLMLADPTGSRSIVGLATPSAPGMIAAAAVAGILAHTEYVFFRERILAGNLGIWSGWFAVLPALVSLSIDTALWMIIPAMRIAGDVLL